MDYMLEPYLNCHALDFQKNGRYWQGLFFTNFAQNFDEDARQLLKLAGKEYISCYETFNQYKEKEIWTDWRNMELRKAAVALLEQALKHEESAIDSLKRAGDSLGLAL
jgi:hypothetical protein